MPFPRLYDDLKCPLDGYEGRVFRVLLNPTEAEKNDWVAGDLGDPACDDCAALNESSPPVADAARVRCPSCVTRRKRLSRAAVAVYGTSAVADFDFTTPASVLASFEQPDLPYDLLRWLLMVPLDLWLARLADLKKKLPQSLTTLS